MSESRLHIILLCISLAFVFVTVSTHAQARTDLELLKSANFKNPVYNKKQVHFGITENKSYFSKYNPVTLTFSSLLYVYQKIISPQISADCLFSPSCSEYSRQLFIHYGLPGVFFTADRLMRCHRISATTFNPVSINETDMKVHENVKLYSLKKTVNK